MARATKAERVGELLGTMRLSRFAFDRPDSKALFTEPVRP